MDKTEKRTKFCMILGPVAWYTLEYTLSQGLSKGYSLGYTIRVPQGYNLGQWFSN